MTNFMDYDVHNLELTAGKDDIEMRGLSNCSFEGLKVLAENYLDIECLTGKF